MKLMEEIEELKEYKEDKDLPIAELARRIEADDTTVGRWLKGGATPSCYSLYKVRRFLNSVKGWEGSKPLEPFKDKVTREHEQTKKDIDYLKQRIMALNDIEDLDTLVTELNVTTQLGNLVRDAHKAPF
ncbi:helix-turn-helix transcriptional regulator [Ligilactobacillus salivarius]|jgi:transcriptional regulator with XRE-family HTH domain|uniref:helix-turn-helix transcriptional regulator n=1 Tax=Ligilactobacillus salivarius TaxID=1624 RepID=UPI002062C9C7|nr:helix-turn-helix transcriptional regulator [Ligilactobacillus salivarius]DAY67736.1 MAG TPA: Regulatory protein [Caudoviricetes sp.]